MILIKSDLQFILDQIAIAEANAAGAPLWSLIPKDQLPWGLRTVDGTFNNIVSGRSEFGAADNVFPRLTTPTFRTAESFDPDGPGPAPASPTSYAQTSGIVVDSQPRLISNLIVDQTAANPAAVAAAGTAIAPPGNNGSLSIPNVSPDAGLLAPFNSWMTFFGQFFDHGLDLVNKGGSGTVFMPLRTDDPLYDPGVNGIAGDADDPATNFMVLTRATNQPGPDGVLGTADDIHEHVNQTTSFVDQNQTYTSHPSHQAFLREYRLDVNGHTVATGHLLEGAGGGLATWDEVKAQARLKLGIDLADADVTDVPVLATDDYGRLLLDANGRAQLLTNAGYVAGDLDAPISTANAARTGHAFLDDIAHAAAPRTSGGAMKSADADAIPGVDDGLAGTYDDELLGAHFITGDGRGNENIGLTAVHHVFHSEHNRLVEQFKTTIVEAGLAGDVAFLQEWLLPGLSTIGGIPDVDWDGERLFQAARMGTEMQYQHLVFEEFARKILPAIDPFALAGGYDVDIDPSITAEFAHVVYRFGHSMLTETVARTDSNGVADDIGLIEAFLNPLAFQAGYGSSDAAAGAIVRGSVHQVANEIDEFITEALRNNLVGLPLDLAALNIARGRDAGIPSLNAARATFHAATGNELLKPYDSWYEFGLNLRQSDPASPSTASLVNFIAAYGTHGSITGAPTLADRRDAAFLLVNGGLGEPTDRDDFMNGTGAWTAANSGLNDVDFWVGGLAEARLLFGGGMLGSTFTFVFEQTLEQLQNGDRFYYLGRTLGFNFLTQLEERSFSEMIMENTSGVGHVPFDIFSVPTHTFELANLNPTGAIQDDLSTPGQNEALLLRRMANGTIRYLGIDHVVMGGTAGNDRIQGGAGQDSIWGDAGNDRIEGGDDDDALLGGAGDDIITDSFGIDTIKGGEGHDVISAGRGEDLALGGFGHDFILGGADLDDVRGGAGNDFVSGGDGHDAHFGNDGDDWLEGGTGNDLLQGDNGAPFFDSPIIGNDVFVGGIGDDDYDAESGDDVMVSDTGIERNAGSFGFDWVTSVRDVSGGVGVGVNHDLTIGAFDAPALVGLRDRYSQVEGASGWRFDDTLRGDDVNHAIALNTDHTLTNFALIDGLQALVDTLSGGPVTVFNSGNILLGGDGSDTIEGGGGDDLIDGDMHLNVRISVRDAIDPGEEIGTANSMAQLQSALLAGMLRPSQLVIVRELLATADAAPDIDTAVYRDVLANYTITTDVNGVTTVTHDTVTPVLGAVDEGTDRLRGIEQLRFADTTIQLGAAPNLAPTGTIAIGPSPIREDGALVATPNLADPNGLSNLASIAYTWEAETVPGSGAYVAVGAGPGFTPGDAHVGKRLRVVASFVDDLGNPETFTSASTTAVINVNDAPVGVPVIGNLAPVQDQALASTATITDADGLGVFAYQWESSVNGLAWTPIIGATLAGFTPGQAQAGLLLRVTVTYTDGHGKSERVVSAPTAAVIDVNDPPVGQPTINDTTPAEGQVLTASALGIADADGLAGATFTFQWQSALSAAGPFTDIVGATGSTFAPGTGEVGLFLRVQVSYQDDGGFSNTITSDATAAVIANVNNPATGVPTISDTTPTEGTPVTASTAGIADVDGLGTFSFQWQQAVSAAGPFFDIAGASSATFNPTQAQVNRVLRVNVQFTDLAGNPESVFSAPTVVVGDLITGGAGAEFLSGTIGQDRILGNGGNDTLDGGPEADVLIGGNGSDTYYVDHAGDVVTETSAVLATGGTDTVITSLASYTVGTNVENLAFNGVGAFSGTGNTQDNVITGGASGDVLNGGAGNDTLDGAAGADTMVGSTGNDTYVVDNAGDIVNETGGTGVDTVLTTRTTFSLATSATLSGTVENLTYTGGAAFTGTGNASANVIRGGTGADTLSGVNGADVLYGGAGTAIDTLNGGAGADTLFGGGGNDRLIGGTGSDQFFISSTPNSTITITDFNANDSDTANRDFLVFQGSTLFPDEQVMTLATFNASIAPTRANVGANAEMMSFDSGGNLTVKVVFLNAQFDLTGTNPNLGIGASDMVFA